MDVKPQFIEELKKNAIQAREQYEACTKLLETFGVSLDKAGSNQAPRKPSQALVTPSMGLRDAIRAILRGQSDGATTREVVDALEAVGWKTSGNTKLPARVSIEISAMKKLKQVKSAAGGKYRLG